VGQGVIDVYAQLMDGYKADRGSNLTKAIVQEDKTRDAMYSAIC
jgi:hypothetical protein